MTPKTMSNELPLKDRIYRRQESTRLLFLFLVYLPLALLPFSFLLRKFPTGNQLSWNALFLVISIIAWVVITGFLAQVAWSYFHVFLLKRFFPDLGQEEAQELFARYYQPRNHVTDKFFRGRDNRFRDYCGTLTRRAVRVTYRRKSG